MTIKDKLAAIGEEKCSYCGEEKLAVVFPPVSGNDMIVICEDCLVEMLEVLDEFNE